MARKLHGRKSGNGLGIVDKHGAGCRLKVQSTELRAQWKKND